MESLLCIPGNWADKTELMLTIVEQTDGQYVMAGNFLFNREAQQGFIIDVHEHDPEMHKAFSMAGIVTAYSEEELEKIANHNLVVYISAETGNLTKAKHLADAAAMLLKIGGLGVKVETAGKAFEKEQWLTQLQEEFEPHKLYPLFVIDSILDQDGTVYSCGMHNLGLPDTIVTGVEFQEAVNLIQIFHYYQIIENPVIQANQTFGAAEDAPVYRILNEEEQPNKGDESFENPFGMWRLAAI